MTPVNVPLDAVPGSPPCAAVKDSSVTPKSNLVQVPSAEVSTPPPPGPLWPEPTQAPTAVSEPSGSRAQGSTDPNGYLQMKEVCLCLVCASSQVAAWVIQRQRKLWTCELVPKEVSPN